MIPLRYVGMGVRRAASIWKVMMNPFHIGMEDISSIFIVNISSASNLSNFKSQIFVHEHLDEKQEINDVLQHVSSVNVDLHVTKWSTSG